jgi:hypothetical protein
MNASSELKIENKTQSKFGFIWWQKIINYEYWPWWLLYTIIFPYYIWLAIKSKSLVFFSNVNTKFEHGGYKNYSKFEILSLIPDDFKPKGFLIKLGQTFDNKPTFPCIAKPDIGERGSGVSIIKDKNELDNYFKKNKGDIIIQEFITLKSEAAVFYCRLPSEKKGKITSLTTKEFLSVIGDGKSSIEMLMNQSLRAVQQIDRLPSEYLKSVPEKNKVVTIESIGNHCRGTKFVNANHLITPKLEAAFDKICKQIDGFHYGRFDLKYDTIDQMEIGENIKIVELNGVSSDPAHIFDQSTGLINSLKSIIYHWNIMYSISKENRALGYEFSTFMDVLKTTLAKNS